MDIIIQKNIHVPMRDDVMLAADLVPAINRIFHDQAHASHVILPIIERN